MDDHNRVCVHHLIFVVSKQEGNLNFSHILLSNFTILSNKSFKHFHQHTLLLRGFLELLIQHFFLLMQSLMRLKPYIIQLKVLQSILNQSFQFFYYDRLLTLQDLKRFQLSPHRFLLKYCYFLH